MNAAAREAGKRLWIGLPGPEVDIDTRILLEEIRPGGVVLFSRNVKSTAQVRELTAALKEILGTHCVISVDQEGGLVVRFRQEATVFPGNMALGAIAAVDLPRALALAEEQGKISAQELRALGVDVNLAPDLDLAVRGDNPGVGIRSFGEDPELVGELGAALVRGTLAGGVTPTLKHYPGLGGATVDPHLDLPRIAESSAAHHLRAFASPLREGSVIVMTTHAVCTDLDPDAPITLSRRVVGGLLRPLLDDRAVIMTDDLEMGAMTRRYGFDDVVRQSAGAGHDVLCICHEPERQRTAHRLLSEALESGAEWYGDPQLIEKRLAALHAWGVAGEVPAPGRGAELAREIAEGAITVVKDDLRQLPIPVDARPLVALPAVGAGTQAEDPLRGEESGEEFVRALGGRATLHRLPLQPTPPHIDALLREARAHTHLIVVLTNARFLESQARLAREAVRALPSTIIAAIRSPFDLEVLPAGARYTGVVSYGFRDDQLRALAATITGRRRAEGRLPVTLQGREASAS